MNLTFEETAVLLSVLDNVMIYCHKNPDGDTLGSAYGLCRMFRQLGKTAWVSCADPIPEKMAYLADKIEPMPEEIPEAIVAVDVADETLLGDLPYKKYILLAIDHHESHRPFAEKVYVESGSASCCEIVYGLCRRLLGQNFTPEIAGCLYTGVATDTGCFKFSNTTPRTHRIAAELMEAGADFFPINKAMFDTKTKVGLALEKLALEKLCYYDDDKIAVIDMTADMLLETGASLSDYDAVTGLPIKIEGVEVGVVLKEKPDEYKVSLRTSEAVDAAAICRRFGGGGHKRAAGCSFQTRPEVFLPKLLLAIREEME